MWQIIRVFVAVFVTFKTLFAGALNGVAPKGIDKYRGTVLLC